MRRKIHFDHKLLVGAIALILCCCTLVGGTLAWFTEAQLPISDGEVTAGVYWSVDLETWHDAEDGTPIFGSTQWEPGQTQIRYIRVVNGAELGFRYTLGLESEDTAGLLAQAIDVYWCDAPATAFTSFRQLQSQSGFAGTLQQVFRAPFVDDTLMPAEGGASTVYALALHMRESAGNTFQGRILENISLTLDATMFSPTVTLDVPLVPGVLTALPESGIAGSKSYSPSGAPYAYTDTSLFAGKKITKIGIPVKTVQAINDKQTFTVYVVKSNTQQYDTSNPITLNLPLDQLLASDRVSTVSTDSGIPVNKWIYVDVSEHNIILREDETLAFGRDGDTVTWGYLQSLSNPSYWFRSNNQNWTAPHKESILFDVYTEETLEFREDQNWTATCEAPVFESLRQAFPAGSISGSNAVQFGTAPYAYTNTATQASLIGNRITRIGIPVKSVQALDDNQTFTLSVVNTTSTAYEYVRQHTLTLPLEQLGPSTTVNRWVYVDVSDLDIVLRENETLAFGGKDDTVTWGWKSGYSDGTYRFRGSGDSWTNQTCGIFFDIHVEKTMTHNDYLELLCQEREHLEAEKERLEQEKKLKEVLAGKKISILGDSISTFKGYSNNTSYNSTIGGNAVYYSGSNYITSVNETWWMQTINRTGMELLVNNSWSGDTVTNTGANRGVSRSLQLHNNEGTTPDLIAVYFGINDFRTKVTAETFAATYDGMVKGMKEKYPNAEIFLFTLVYTTNVNSGVKPDDVVNFNAAIEAAAEKYGCSLVDLYNDSGITKETMAANMGDGNLHPNYAGMDKITETFVDVLMKKYVPAES